jgi:hypothetical protein
MKTRTSLAFSSLLVIVASLTGCDFKVNFTNSATPGITEATLAKGYDVVKHDAIDPATTFSTNDKVVYCVVKLGNVPKASKIRGEWMTVKAEGEPTSEQLLIAKEIDDVGGDLKCRLFLFDDGEWIARRKLQVQPLTQPQKGREEQARQIARLYLKGVSD